MTQPQPQTSPLRLLFAPLLAPLQGKKTYFVGGLVLLNALYTLVVGEPVPALAPDATWNLPSTAEPTMTTAVGGALGAGMMTIRAAISKVDAKLTTMVNDLASTIVIEEE